MKSYSLRITSMLVAVSLAAGGLGGCKKDVENTSPAALQSTSALDVISASPNHTILRAAIEKTGLGPLLSASTNYSVLAPTNAAFAQLTGNLQTYASVDSVRGASAARTAILQNILLYHIFAGKNNLGALPAGGVPTQRAPLANARRDNQLFFTRQGNNVLVNGGVVTITQQGLEADNGFVFPIDRVLTPFATQTIAAAVNSQATNAVVANRQFTRLLDALRQQSVQTLQLVPPGVPLLALLGADQTVPASNGRVTNYTVFAPTDAAFQVFLTAQGITNLSQVPLATLTTLLQRHVVATRVFPVELAGGTALTSLASGNTLTVGGTTGNFTVTSSATNVPANLVGTPVLGTNGNIYPVDAVL